MRYLFIASHREVYPVTLMCEVLEVSRSGFYDWQDRAPSLRDQRRAALTAQVHVAFEASRQTYGSPRITCELADQGIQACRNTVAHIMRQEQLAARQRRRFVPRTNRRFARSAHCSQSSGSPLCAGPRGHAGLGGRHHLHPHR